MWQRVFTWLLVTAMAAAPVAPAWAMARRAPAPVDATPAPVETTQVADTQDSSGNALHHNAPSARVARNSAAVHVHRQSLAHRIAANDRVANDRVAIDSPQALATPSLHVRHAMHTAAAPISHSADDTQGLSAAGHSSADCGDGRCDGQCCGVCILTLVGGSMSYPATVTFGASDSPSYRAHTYTSFVSSLLGRPPQS